MTTDRDHDDEAVVERLRAMPRDIDPPPALEARVTKQLAGRGLLRRRWMAMGTLATAAAIVIAFLGGLKMGAHDAAAPPTHGRYLLLLYAGPSPASPGEDDVETYGRWARDLRHSGRYVSGERLAPGQVSPETPATGDALEGYFVIEATSDEDARTIAASHPHHRHGGRVVVRRIEPT
jgi:hypothetical protein